MERRGVPARLRHRLGVMLAAGAVALALLAVSSAVPSAPTAALEVDDRTPLVGETVRFDASGSQGHDEGNGRIAAYRFDFGDGEGSNWQDSPFADHAYRAPGPRTARAFVRDLRGLEGSATADLDVRSVPPPTGEAPDLVPVQAGADPAEPSVDDVVRLAITIANLGGTTATAAVIDLTDLRPSGEAIDLGPLRLEEPLAPGGFAILFSPNFLAVEEGTHHLRVRVGSVSPPEELTTNNELTVDLEVHPSVPPEDGQGGAAAFPIDLLVLGLLIAAGIALVAAIVLLVRPREPIPLEPPSHIPPDRRPPPIWPP